MSNQPWRLKNYTHDIVALDGKTVARLRIYKNYQLAIDHGDGGKIDRSGGSSAFGYHVCFAVGGRANFPADNIAAEIHYFTARDYSGCAVIQRENAP